MDDDGLEADDGVSGKKLEERGKSPESSDEDSSSLDWIFPGDDGQGEDKGNHEATVPPPSGNHRYGQVLHGKVGHSENFTFYNFTVINYMLLKLLQRRLSLKEDYVQGSLVPNA